MRNWPIATPVLAGAELALAPTKARHDYLPGLDLVRFLSAVSVAAFHLTRRNYGDPTLMPFGWVGVEVFFVISGLVIANSAGGATPSSFAANRFLRLYPGAWCSAAITLGIPFLAGVVMALFVVGAIAVLVATILEPALRNWIRQFMMPRPLVTVGAEPVPPS